MRHRIIACGTLVRRSSACFASIVASVALLDVYVYVTLNTGAELVVRIHLSKESYVARVTMVCCRATRTAVVAWKAHVIRTHIRVEVLIALARAYSVCK